MLKSPREKAILKQGILVLGILVGLYLFLLRPFLKEGSSILDDELERKTAEINKYISRTGSMPSRAGFERLEQDKRTLESKLEGLIDFVDPEKVRISEATSEGGLYFIEQLHSTIKKFSEKAEAKNVKLPENLGFGDGLPKSDMVDALLRQLETVELVLGILLESEDIDIYAIKPLKSIEYREPYSKEVFYIELPVQISVKTDTRTLVNLLLKLKNSSPVVSVKELHIKSGEVKDIEVSLVLSTFKIVREKQT